MEFTPVLGPILSELGLIAGLILLVVLTVLSLWRLVSVGKLVPESSHLRELELERRIAQYWKEAWEREKANTDALTDGTKAMVRELAIITEFIEGLKEAANK